MDIETKKQLLTVVKVIEKLQNKLKDNDVNIETIDTTIKELQSELDKTNKELSSSLKLEINTLKTSLNTIKDQFKSDTSKLDTNLIDYSQKQQSVLNGLKSALESISYKLNDYATKEDITQIDNRISVEVSDLTNKINKIPKPKEVDLSSYAKKSDIPKEITKTEVIEKTIVEKPIEITPDIEIGNVTTLDPGNKANVYISKKDDKYKLDFEIPRGVTGGHGKPGQNGLTTSVNNIEQVNGNVSLTTDDIPDTATNMYVPTLPTASPTSKYLNGAKEWAEISADEIPIVDEYSDLADLDSGITKAIVRQDTLADRTYTTLDGSTQYEVLYVNPLPPLYGETYEDTYFLSTGAGGTGTIQGQVEASEDDGFRLWTLQLSGIYLGAVALAVQQNYIGGEFEISFNGKTNIRLSGGWIDNLAYVDTATDEVLDITMYDKKPDTVSAFLTCYITPASNDAANWHRIKYALQPTPFEIKYSGVYEKIDDTWTLVVKNDKLVNGNIGLPLPS